MSACRLCKKEDHEVILFKYAVRHWACGKCGLEKWGKDFLDMIPEHELGRLPYGAVRYAGLMEEVQRRIK